MKRSLLLFGLFFVALGVFAQRPLPRIAMFAQFDCHIANAPFRIYDPNGTKMDAKRLHSGFNWWKAFMYGEDLIYGNTPQPAIGFFMTMPMIPIAAKVSCAYERTAFKMTYPGESESLIHISNGIKPEVELYYVFENPTKFIKPAVLFGGAYHIPLTFRKGESEENVAMLNRGLELAAGFSFLFIPGRAGYFVENNENYHLEISSGTKNGYIEFGLVYRYTLYNYFNQDYTQGMSMPYSGITTKYGEICLRLVVGGFFPSRNQRISSW